MVFEKHEHHTDGSESWITTVNGKSWKVIKRTDKAVKIYRLSGVASEEVTGVDLKAAVIEIQHSLDRVMMEARLLSVKLGLA
jgi:hypothetical protein